MLFGVGHSALGLSERGLRVGEAHGEGPVVDSYQGHRALGVGDVLTRRGEYSHGHADVVLQLLGVYAEELCVGVHGGLSRRHSRPRRRDLVVGSGKRLEVVPRILERLIR